MQTFNSFADLYRDVAGTSKIAPGGPARDKRRASGVGQSLNPPPDVLACVATGILTSHGEDRGSAQSDVRQVSGTDGPAPLLRQRTSGLDGLAPLSRQRTSGLDGLAPLLRQRTSGLDGLAPLLRQRNSGVIPATLLATASSAGRTISSGNLPGSSAAPSLGSATSNSQLERPEEEVSVGSSAFQVEKSSQSYCHSHQENQDSHTWGRRVLRPSLSAHAARSRGGAPTQVPTVGEEPEAVRGSQLSLRSSGGTVTEAHKWSAGAPGAGGMSDLMKAFQNVAGIFHKTGVPLSGVASPAKGKQRRPPARYASTLASYKPIGRDPLQPDQPSEGGRQSAPQDVADRDSAPCGMVATEATGPEPSDP